MTLNNSILISIKQANGLAYNDLLSKISSRYKNQSSANSALSRALKNLLSLGLMQKKENQYYITDKGLASISIEMKEKLVLKLNEAMKKPLNNLEEIIQLLAVLSQRSSQDNDLLINAKEYSSFTINDVEEIRKAISQKRLELKKINTLMKKQCENLIQLDFNDSREHNIDADFVKKIIDFSFEKKVIFETKDNFFIELVPIQWKKESIVSVEGPQINEFFDLILDNKLIKGTIYLQDLKISLSKGRAKCYSSYSKLEKIFK